MADLKLFFFRFEIITKAQPIDNSKAVAVGFWNLGINQAFVNRTMPIPFGNPPTNNSIIWMPINQNERDATKYEINFDGAGGGTRHKVMVIYKEPYNG